MQKVQRRLGALYAKRHYYLHKISPSKVPVHNLAYLPDGFAITKAGQTGVSIMDNFCTPEEAEAIIEFSRDKIHPAGVLQGDQFVEHPKRRCDTGAVFGPGRVSQEILPVALRAAAVTGLPYTHIEGVYVTRYPEGGMYDEHIDFGDHYKVDRLYTILLYLNTVPPEQGGSTVFPRLNIKVQPRVGRAVCWTNKNPDGSHHNETSHAALPVEAGGEKWAIQFWFHPHKMFDPIDIEAPQIKTGIPLGEDAVLPDGASRYIREER
jgi:prolyl 4-hydroxylase